MSQRIRCRKGHRWTPTLAPGAWPPDFRSPCPVCGGGPVGPFDVTVGGLVTLGVLSVALLVAGLVLHAVLLAPDRNVGLLLLAVSLLLPLLCVMVWFQYVRKKEIAKIAEQMGLTFMAELAAAGLAFVAPFRLTTQGNPPEANASQQVLDSAKVSGWAPGVLGDSRKAYNAMQGRVGDCDLLFFEYQYAVRGGRSHKTCFQSAVILFDGAVGLPEFLLTPRTSLDKLARSFAQAGAELDVAEEFAQRCELSGPDADALRAAFRPELMRFLGGTGSWFIESVRGQLLLHRSRRVPPEQIPGLVADALRIRDMLRGQPAA